MYCSFACSIHYIQDENSYQNGNSPTIVSMSLVLLWACNYLPKLYGFACLCLWISLFWMISCCYSKHASPKERWHDKYNTMGQPKPILTMYITTKIPLMRENVDCSKLFQSLNFFFSEAKPFKLFFTQCKGGGWVGIFPRLLQLLFQHSYLQQSTCLHAEVYLFSNISKYVHGEVSTCCVLGWVA